MTVFFKRPSRVFIMAIIFVGVVSCVGIGLVLFTSDSETEVAGFSSALDDHKGTEAGARSAQTRASGRVNSGMDRGAPIQSKAGQSIAKNMDHLPIESAVLLNGQIYVSAAESILGSDAFASTLESLEQQMMQDPLAEALTNTYRDSIERQLAAQTDGLQVDRLACGLRICMGSIHSQGLTDEDWAAWLDAFGHNPETPHYTLVDQTIDLGDDVAEHRLVFSTDPESNAIVVPLK